MNKTTRKSRCWACKSLNIIRWGTQSGKQRFKCNNCGILFTAENDGVKRNNEIVWFKMWVLERQTIKLISKKSKISERTLKRKFYTYLESYPQWIIPKNRCVNLVLDGTYFKNGICLFLYLDNHLKDALLYRTTTDEYADEIEEDLINIMRSGIIISSITSDGHKSILKAIKGANKWIQKYNKENNTTVQQIVNQRCLVHIQRSCLMLLREEHQSIAGRKLRTIAMTICKLDTFQKRDLFLNAFNYWFNEHSDYVTQFTYSSSGRKSRTHKDLYSAYRKIKLALPSMFHYLDYPQIPNTTNSMEGYFSYLKSDISFHRGLSKAHFKNFLRWYIYFRNKRK